MPNFSARAFGLLVFLFPVFLAYPISVVGEFYVGEVLAAILFFWTFRCRAWVFRNVWFRYLFLTGVMWLAAIIVSDLWHGTSPRDMIRGWGEIGLMLLMLYTFRILIGHNSARLALAVIGALIGVAIRLTMFPNPGEATVPLSLGGAWALTLLVILLVPHLERPFNRISVPLLLASMSALFFTQGARNAAGTAALTAGYLVLARIWARRSGPGPTRRQLVLAVLVMAIVGAGLYSAYSWTARSGALGTDVQQKFEIQASGSWGPFVGGRPENVATIYAIADSPLIGHGSRPEGIAYQEDALSFLKRSGYTVSPWRSEEIPAHSHVLAAWLSAGLFALPFWLLVLGLALRSLVGASRLPPPWVGVTAYLALYLMWSWLFSPYGGAGRTILALVLVVLIASIDEPLWLGVKGRSPRVRAPSDRDRAKPVGVG